MTDETDTSVAVTEAKRQLVILTFTLIGAVAVAYIIPLQQDAAARDRLIIRGALKLKRFAQANADLWTGIALKAGTVYNQYRTN